MATHTIWIDSEEIPVTVGADHAVAIDGLPDAVDVRQRTAFEFSVLVGGQPVTVFARRHGEEYHVMWNGQQMDVRVETARARLLRSLARAQGTVHRRLEIRAPMPALVTRVEVLPGSEVHDGQVLVVLEAMKMENLLKAPQSGHVKEVHAKPGMPVEKGALLMTLE